MSTQKNLPRKTVIIVGAGAGVGFGMPTGEKLIGKISNKDEVLKNIYFSFFKESLKDIGEESSNLYAQAIYEVLFGKHQLSQIFIDGNWLISRSGLANNHVVIHICEEKRLAPESFLENFWKIFSDKKLDDVNEDVRLKKSDLDIKIQQSEKFKPYFDLSEIVSYYRPFSIDELLDSIKRNKINTKIHNNITTERNKLVEVGKALIAIFLLDAERVDFLEKAGTFWYQHLRNAIITSGKDFEEIKMKLENLTLISFNYDRSLDYFLRTRLDEFYSFIKVIYPYGKLARDWDGSAQNYVEVSYGHAEINKITEKTLYLAENIAKDKLNGLRIIGELDESDDGKEIKIEIKRNILEAHNFYFLGFGFNDENCRVLGLEGNQIKSLIDTSLGAMSSNITKVFYTNFENSKKIEQKFREVVQVSQENYGYNRFVSEKGVYEAMCRDFNLSLS